MTGYCEVYTDRDIEEVIEATWQEVRESDNFDLESFDSPRRSEQVQDFEEEILAEL